MKSDKLLLAILAFGFLTLAIDVKHMHSGIVAKNSFAWIPILFGAIACVACLALLAPLGKGRFVAACLLGLGPIVGGLGMFFHYQDSPGILALTVRDGVPGGKSLMKEPSEDDYPNPGAPPLLAPMGFAGLGLLGCVIALRQDDKKGGRSKSK